MITMAITFVCIALITIGMFIRPAIQVASAEREYPDRAKLLGQWIDEKVETRKKLVDAKAVLEAQLGQNARDIADVESASSGYRKSLCSDFKLLRDNGEFREAADCLLFQ